MFFCVSGLGSGTLRRTLLAQGTLDASQHCFGMDVQCGQMQSKQLSRISSPKSVCSQVACLFAVSSPHISPRQSPPLLYSSKQILSAVRNKDFAAASHISPPTTSGAIMSAQRKVSENNIFEVSVKDHSNI